MMFFARIAFLLVILLPEVAVLQTTAQARPIVNGETSDFKAAAKAANEAREQNRLADAFELYKKALKLNPSWRDGWWFLGSLYYDEDQYSDGRDAFRRLTVLDPKASLAWVMTGLCEYQTKEYDKSFQHLLNAERLGVDSTSQFTDVSRYHLALLLTRNEQYEEAVDILSRFARAGKQEPTLIEAMGIAVLRKPLLPAEVPSPDRELIMSTGRAAWDATARRVNEADAEFKALLEEHPKQANLNFIYGSFLMQSDPDLGLAAMKQELEISPDHLPSLVSIAAEYLKRKDFKTAQSFAEKAVSVSPDSFAAKAILGRVLCEGDIDGVRGLSELESAQKLAPGSPQVRFALATAYAKVGRNADAARERAEFLRLQDLTKQKPVQ